MMKRSLVLSLILALAATMRADAAINLSTGDAITFVGQTSGLSTGGGGQFDWIVASTAPRTNGTQPPAVNTAFNSFCAQLEGDGSWLNQGETYTINRFITPIVGQVINKAGATLLDSKGAFLFDAWSEGKIAQTQSGAAAVQVALWMSEGYTGDEIVSTARFTSSELAAAENLEHSLLKSLGYHCSWQIPTDDKVMVLGGQDQWVDPGNSGVPEPSSIVVWSLLGAAGVAIALRSKPGPKK
jgi:hypothetical protein